MERKRRYLVFGPAYLDVVVETAVPLIPGDPALLVDQSLPALRMTPRGDDLLVVNGPTGDRLIFPLPADASSMAATYTLTEPVLARLLGAETQRTVAAEYPVARFVTQLGGMGAGYAKAFDGLLRAPFGAVNDVPDAVGQAVLGWLQEYGITVAPALLPGYASDSSLVLLSAQGDKLAIGVRAAMVRWQATDADRALVAEADALVFCGAPNALVGKVLSWRPAAPVMCAPALRNVMDTATPLSALAGGIHYLTLNALEWAHLADAEHVRAMVPVITVTDGPRGSRVLLRDEELTIPAESYVGPANTNRAGETYASTFFKVLLSEQPDFYQRGVVPTEIAMRAGLIATAQATRQLAIPGFAFPPDDWT